MPRRSPLLTVPALSLLAVLGLLANGVVAAELELPRVFGDHMVLQRDRPVPVWGHDVPGTEVRVTIAGRTASAEAGDGGAWKAMLPALPAGGPHTLKVDGSEELEFEDVLVGEVWLCSGQSNMEWPVRRVMRAEEEIAAADHPRIRHLSVAHTPAAEPQGDIRTGGWTLCSPDTVGSFTAAGYFFARQLLQELDVPVGLLGSNWGGTRIEPWTPPEGFRAVPALDGIASRIEELPETRKGGEIHHQSPLALWNGMIAPLVPYAIRGALWYQGEANMGEGMLYHEKMKALIHGWRHAWDREDLPFYFVQLAPYRYGGDPQRLPELWEAQSATLSLPHTGMAATVDIGNVSDIHPRNKQDVGKRLALIALAKTYGREDLVWSGPVFRSMEVEGRKARLRFDHVDGGLVSRDGEPLNRFEVAGKDGEFVEAEAAIDGETVVVHADSVAEPTAVRFAWHQEAEPNLANRAGLPAVPFRTRDE